MSRDAPLLERLARLPAVPVGDLLALIERLARPDQDPLLAASGPGTRLAAQVRDLVAQPDLVVNPATREMLAPALVAHLRLAMANALHGVFVVGLIVCVVALASSFLVPSGRARDLARAEEAAPTAGS